MTATREAKYLFGADLGKTITATCRTEGRTVAGGLDYVTPRG